jgi:hypothetical protein
MNTLRSFALVVVVVLVLLAAGRATHAEPGVLFQDDFSDGDDVGWSVVEGAWTVVDGVYVAPDPGGWNLVVKSIAGEDWWGDYTFEGRFMLEPCAACGATLLFRVQWALPGVNHGEFYQIANWVGSVQLGEAYGVQGGPNIIGREPVPYSLEADTWYSFRIVLNGPSMQYYIDDNLAMSYDDLTSYSGGKIGLKTAHDGQAYFDDILVYSGAPPPTPAPAVGGMVEMQVHGSAAGVDSAAGSSGGSAARSYLGLAGAVALGVIAVAAGAWYTRRRWVR